MFEYLMPRLFIRDFNGSLLDQTCQAAVRRQIAYGRRCRVPWGISESAFGALAANSDYHYQSFGVPGLGLKRGLAKDLVISPYSTALAVELTRLKLSGIFATGGRRGREGNGGFLTPWTTRRPASLRMSGASWCAATWRITMA
jgi:cyclic beta-1,2-glucan synthetase